MATETQNMKIRALFIQKVCSSKSVPCRQCAELLLVANIILCNAQNFLHLNSCTSAQIFLLWSYPRRYQHSAHCAKLPLLEFLCNCFIGTSTKIVQAIMMRQKTWLLEDGAYFTIYIEVFKIRLKKPGTACHIRHCYYIL